MSLELETSPVVSEAAPIELFKLDGKSYTIPNEPRFNMQLQYMQKMQDESEMLAGAWMLTELVGKEAFSALANFRGLTRPQFDQVILAARKVVFGELEEDSGKA